MKLYLLISFKKDSSCKFNASNVGGTCSGYVSLTSGSEYDLTAAVANIGPISVAVDANTLQFYSSGIYYSSNCSSSDLNHGVTVVGYGTSSTGLDYYIVKNSWGSTWGENGYIYMSRNRNNNCGIATAGSYPIV
jgi:C1A family cysteine protease